MTATETIVRKFETSPSGSIFRELFGLLARHGLRPLGKSNTGTLLYQHHRDGGIVDNVFAFRLGPPRVISFPKSYWQSRSVNLGVHLEAFGYAERPPISGPVSESQNSAGQIELNSSTMERVLEICRDICATL